LQKFGVWVEVGDGKGSCWVDWRIWCLISGVDNIRCHGNCLSSILDACVCRHDISSTFGGVEGFLW